MNGFTVEAAPDADIGNTVAAAMAITAIRLNMFVISLPLCSAFVA